MSLPHGCYVGVEYTPDRLQHGVCCGDFLETFREGVEVDVTFGVEGEVGETTTGSGVLDEGRPVVASGEDLGSDLFCFRVEDRSGFLGTSGFGNVETDPRVDDGLDRGLNFGRGDGGIDRSDERLVVDADFDGVTFGVSVRGGRASDTEELLRCIHQLTPCFGEQGAVDDLGVCFVDTCTWGGECVELSGIGGDLELELKSAAILNNSFHDYVCVLVCVLSAGEVRR